MKDSRLDWPVDSRGIWIQYLSSPKDGSQRSAPILFFDRDGVLVEEVHYLHRAADVRIYPDSIELIRTAKLQGWRVVIVTNQAGVGKGLYGWDEFASVNAHFLNELSAVECTVDAVLAAPHHTDGLGEFKVADHPMRKPRPGMLLEAINAFGSDAAQCIVVGDRATDLEAGRSAGLARAVLVKTGYGASEVEAANHLANEHFCVVIADNLRQFPRDWLGE
jgi:D-glycero-D-manno-heptose 1,7-bisphosphate phosphatase